MIVRNWSESVREFNPFLMKNAKVFHDYGTLAQYKQSNRRGRSTN